MPERVEFLNIGLVLVCLAWIRFKSGSLVAIRESTGFLVNSQKRTWTR